PDYFKLKYSFPTLSLAELQTKLAADETFVEYFWGDRKLYFFTATQASASFGSLDLTGELRQNVEEFKNLNGNHKALNRAENLKLHQRLGHSIYQKLVEPLRLKTPKVLLAADAWLNLIPFDALATDSIPRKNYSEFPFLIYRRQITKVFSATVFGQQLAAEKKPIVQPTVSAKTKQKPQKNLLLISPQTLGGKGLPGRPDSLALKFGGDALLGEKATKEAVFKLAPNYRRLLFYAHAKADTVEPFIRLFEEERLFLGDLYAHHLPVKLVVLAACEAGTGKIKRGEGIMSLARGFAYSGVPAVSLTLWEVRSGTTLLITEIFLENHLRQGMSPSDAMHQAKLRFLKNPPMGDASPHLWAGFVMVGK
ncbi:MAG: CHAT domain-containing protein, partial [Bacteroidota bacterium]